MGGCDDALLIYDALKFITVYAVISNMPSWVPNNTDKSTNM